MPTSKEKVLQDGTNQAGSPAPRVDVRFDLDAFNREGIAGPSPFLSSAQTRLLVQHMRRRKVSATEPWRKAQGAADPVIYEIAVEPRLLSALRELLGQDVILWGASFQHRVVGRAHSWHVDAESQNPNHRFASLWVGLENTSRESALKFATRSHRFDKTLIQLAAEQGLDPAKLNDESVMDLAQSLDPSSDLVQYDMADGDAVLFHGRAWHCSHNTRAEGARNSLLLQYAAADAPVHIPEDFHVWPTVFKAEPRPPVVAVSGQADVAVNDVFDRPVAVRATESPVSTAVYQPSLPISQNAETGFASDHYFRGSTGLHHRLTCHASVLSPGATPHPPHCHVEEEILIVLDGAGELRVAPDIDTEDVTPHPVQSGAVAYYPSYWFHTLTNTSDGPLTYLMFKWQGRPTDMDEVLPAQIHDSTRIDPKPGKAFRHDRLFEGPTQFLSTLHMHVSEVDPSGGYRPHVDPYDVAIIVLSGIIETAGQRLGPGGVAYFATGELHGLRGIGPNVARYLVVEFRGPLAEKPPLDAKGQRHFRTGNKPKSPKPKRPKRPRMQKYRNSIVKRLPRFLKPKP